MEPEEIANRTALSCGHARPIAPINGATGVAILPDGSEICYACADERTRERMRHEDTIGAYLASDGLSVTTWSGGVLARVISAHTRRVGFGRTSQTYWRAVDANGRHWYGRGGRGMHTTMRARKVDRLPTTSTCGRCGSEYAGDTCDGPGYHP